MLMTSEVSDGERGLLVPSATKTPDAVALIAQPHPFKHHDPVQYVPPGGSLVDILKTQSPIPAALGELLILVNDQAIPRALWSVTIPEPGDVVHIRVIPRGGGGKIIKTLATVAIIGLSVAFPPFAPLIAIGGKFLLNALFPPPSPNRGQSASGKETLVYSITGVGNTPDPYGVIPKVFGKVKMFPKFPGKGPTQYTEIAGDDQYLRVLLLIGYGPVTVTELKIGNTPIDNYTDVSYEIREGKSGDAALTLFTKDVDEQSFQSALTSAGGLVQRTTGLAVSEISIDIAFDKGLVKFDNQGVKQTQAVTVTVEYKLVTDGGWTSAGTIAASAATSKLHRKTLKWSVTSGQYDVRLLRTTADTNDSQIFDTVFWTALRGFTLGDPINRAGLAVIAIRIKATDQLSGRLDTVNCLVESELAKHNGSSWQTPVATRNPAWAMVDILTGAGNQRALAQSRLDEVAFKAFADRCDTEGREFNHVFDSGTTVGQALALAAGAGRATPDIKDGKHTVVEDLAQSVPVQHFTDHNSWGYTWDKVFVDRPHAFKIQFLNELENYQQDEEIVYDDGYDAQNANEFNTIEYIGITHPDQVWKRGRYDIAVVRLRPDSHSFNTDFEHLQATRGDMVCHARSVILVGGGSGRIKAIGTSGSDVTTITLDRIVVMELGRVYSVRIRTTAENDSLLEAVDTDEGEQTLLTFSTPVPDSGTQPAVGDLVQFGETGLESVEGLIKAIEPFQSGGGLNARITLVDAAPAVLDADTGAIPQFMSKITLLPVVLREEPPVPIIVSVRSDESVLERSVDGSLVPRIMVGLTVLSGIEIKDLLFFGQIKETGSNDRWTDLKPTPATQGDYEIFPVTQGDSYDLRFKLGNLAGQTSAWTTPITEVVTGKGNPPPNVTTFMVDRQSDGTREFMWTTDDPPLDLDGVKLRFKLGTGGTWETMADLHEGLLKASPFETNLLAAGTYTLAAKNFDTSGNESANALIIESTIGDPRLGGAIAQANAHGQGFPGTKTDCFVDEMGDLIPTGAKTWADFTTDAVTWAAWNSWNRVPNNPIVYEHPAFDLGLIIKIKLLVSVTGTGTHTITEAHSDTDSGYTSFAAITGEITARWFKIKVSTAHANGKIENVFIIWDASALVEEINDVAMSSMSGTTGSRRLPIAKDFAVITQVTLALQSVIAGYSWSLEDHDETLGPEFKVWDETDTPVDINVDAVVRGIAT